jgi:hypothetical protein
VATVIAPEINGKSAYELRPNKCGLRCSQQFPPKPIADSLLKPYLGDAVPVNQVDRWIDLEIYNDICIYVYKYIYIHTYIYIFTIVIRILSQLMEFMTMVVS